MLVEASFSSPINLELKNLVYRFPCMNRNLGIDVKLMQGSMAITPSGDIGWVGGINNLKQAIIHRIHTTIGELFNHPEYGGIVVNSVSRPNTKVNIGRIYTAIVMVLSQEPRIESIDKLEIQSIGKYTIQIDLDFTPIEQNTSENLLLQVSA
jgi:phage baseplate assembly protein W